MIVYFIGGPRDGEREAVLGITSDRIMVPVSIRSAYIAAEFANPVGPLYATHECKVIRRKRYAIAEYVEPQIEVKWAVTLEVDEWDTDGLNALSKFLWERKVGEVDAGVRWTSAATMRLGVMDITLGIKVTGPPDSGAIVDAAEKAQVWLERNAPKAAKVTVSAASTA